MKILMIGSGGREHALIRKLMESPRVEQIYCAPGNGGIAALAQGVGMVQGAWAGDRTATRAEGAVMLHKLLSW